MKPCRAPPFVLRTIFNKTSPFWFGGFGSVKWNPPPPAACAEEVAAGVPAVSGNDELALALFLAFCAHEGVKGCVCVCQGGGRTATNRTLPIGTQPRVPETVEVRVSFLRIFFECLPRVSIRHVGVPINRCPALCLFLAGYSRTSGPEGKWWPYISSLPEPADYPQASAHIIGPSCS